MDNWFLSYLWGMETSIIDTSIPKSLSSYPTYEEWKQTMFHHMLPPLCEVLILPMRNGNSNFFLLSCISFSVLILPMRNGNYQLNISSIYHYLVLILPMRNGNNLPFVLISLLVLFLSYLWGMETKWEEKIYLKTLRLFLSYLWGMET